MDEREIIACSRYESVLDVDYPQDVTLSIVCNDGLYRTKTRLKSFEADEPYTFFYLETPQNIEYQQNREYFRVPMAYRCTYSIVLNREPIKIEAKTVDISANGVSIIAPQLIVLDRDIDLALDINGKIINTKSKFVRSEKLDNGYKISFMYKKITENDRDIISQACIKKQLEQKRNRLV